MQTHSSRFSHLGRPQHTHSVSLSHSIYQISRALCLCLHRLSVSFYFSIYFSKYQVAEWVTKICFSSLYRLVNSIVVGGRKRLPQLALLVGDPDWNYIFKIGSGLVVLDSVLNFINLYNRTRDSLDWNQVIIVIFW